MISQTMHTTKAETQDSTLFAWIRLHSLREELVLKKALNIVQQSEMTYSRSHESVCMARGTRQEGTLPTTL